MAAPPLTFVQARLLARLEAAARLAGGGELTWRSGWSGYLPYGVVQWVECAGGDISRDFPPDWSASDLHALEAAGHLRQVGEHRNPDDEFERSTTYRLASPG